MRVQYDAAQFDIVPGLRQEVHIGCHHVMRLPGQNHLFDQRQSFVHGDIVKSDSQHGDGRPFLPGMDAGGWKVGHSGGLKNLCGRMIHGEKLNPPVKIRNGGFHPLFVIFIVK